MVKVRVLNAERTLILPPQQQPLRIRQETTAEALLRLQPENQQVPEIRIAGFLTEIGCGSQF